MRIEMGTAPRFKKRAGDFSPLAGLAPGRRLLGLDHGARRIGIAVSDPARRIALPVRVLVRTRLAADLDALRRLAAEYRAGAIVLGLPLRMDGSEGRRAQAVRSFARDLEGALGNQPGPPLVLWDERLSTKAAEQMHRQAQLPKPKSAAQAGFDDLAAVHILQGALDRLAQPSGATG